MTAKNKSVPEMGKMKIKTFKINEVAESEYNPRRISDTAYAGLAKSLERFGMVQPVIVNTRGGKNTVIGGHQRLKVLAAMDVKRIQCVTVSLTEAEEKLLNVTLNNPKIQGEFTYSLAQQIAELSGNLKNREDLVTLRINELKQEVGIMGDNSEDKKEILTRPLKQTHILLSFSPDILGDIAGPLQEIIETPGVGYVQGAN